MKAVLKPFFGAFAAGLIAAGCQTVEPAEKPVVPVQPTIDTAHIQNQLPGHNFAWSRSRWVLLSKLLKDRVPETPEIQREIEDLYWGHGLMLLQKSKHVDDRSNLDAINKLIAAKKPVARFVAQYMLDIAMFELAARQPYNADMRPYLIPGVTFIGETVTSMLTKDDFKADQKFFDLRYQIKLFSLDTRLLAGPEFSSAPNQAQTPR